MFPRKPFCHPWVEYVEYSDHELFVYREITSWLQGRVLDFNVKKISKDLMTAGLAEKNGRKVRSNMHRGDEKQFWEIVQRHQRPGTPPLKVG